MNQRYHRHLNMLIKKENWQTKEKDVEKKQKHKFRSISNLEGNRLANESLDGFLQLLCPIAWSTYDD